MSAANLEMIDVAVDILKNANFDVLRYSTPQAEMSFDLLARKKPDSSLNLILKIIPNIDLIKPHFLHELKLVAHLINAIPILIGQENRRNSLEDNIIYIRKQLLAININTFKQIVNHPEIPLAIAKKGGYFIDVDGDKIARLRKEKGLTRRELAERMDLSSKAIGEYEKQSMRPSVDHASKLEQILGDSVVNEQDFMEYLKHSVHKTLEAFSINPKYGRKITTKTQDFISIINEIVDSAGYEIFWTKTAPFDLVIYRNDDEDQIKDFTFMGGTQCDTKILSQPTHHFLHQKIVKDGGIIYDENCFNEDDARKTQIPYIIPKDLKLLDDDPKKFQKLLRDRDHREQ